MSNLIPNKIKNTYGYKFYCRDSKKNKYGLSKIEMSITINQKRVFINLPMECSPSAFNSKHKPKEVEDYISLIRVRMDTVAKALGHGNAKTTATYYASLTKETVVSEIASIL